MLNVCIYLNAVLQDALVKQGMYTQYAENLLKSVTDAVNSARYDVTLAKNCILSLMPHFQTDGKLSLYTLLGLRCAGVMGQGAGAEC